MSCRPEEVPEVVLGEVLGEVPGEVPGAVPGEVLGEVPAVVLDLPNPEEGPDLPEDDVPGQQPAPPWRVVQRGRRCAFLFC